MTWDTTLAPNPAPIYLNRAMLERLDMVMPEWTSLSIYRPFLNSRKGGVKQRQAVEGGSKTPLTATRHWSRRNRKGYGHTTTITSLWQPRGRQKKKGFLGFIGGKQMRKKREKAVARLGPNRHGGGFVTLRSNQQKMPHNNQTSHGNNHDNKLLLCCSFFGVVFLNCASIYTQTQSQ